MKRFYRLILLVVSVPLFASCGAGDPESIKGSIDTAEDVHEFTSLDTTDVTPASTDSISSDEDASTEDIPAEVPPPQPPAFLGGKRQAPFFLPAAYDPEVPMPVLVLIHGFTASGYWTADWWKIHQAANDAGILLIIPEGTIDPAGAPFWNATEFCCDFYGSGVDDLGYLTGLIDEAKSYFSVDPSRIYLMGHSNGGFMSHQIACERSDLIAAIVNMGGSTWYNPEDCENPEPVSVLQVHGTWDTVILYGGIAHNVGDPGAEPINAHSCLLSSCNTSYTSCLDYDACDAMVKCFVGCGTTPDPQTCNGECWNDGGIPAQILWMEALTCGMSAGCYIQDPTVDAFGYASVDEGAARWAAINGCADSQVDATPMDLVTEIPGDDTYPRIYEDCPPGLAADIWKIVYGGHTPGFHEAWAPNVIDWMLNQSKPHP